MSEVSLWNLVSGFAEVVVEKKPLSLTGFNYQLVAQKSRWCATLESRGRASPSGVD